MNILLTNTFPALEPGLKSMLSQSRMGKVNILDTDLAAILKGGLNYGDDTTVFLVLDPSAVVFKKVQAVSLVRKKLPACRIIVFEIDTKMNDENIIQYIRAGASGFLNLESSAGDFADCLSEVREGRHYISFKVVDSIIRRLMDVTAEPDASGKNPKERIRLTNAEWEVAEFLMEGKSNSWISETTGRHRSTISTIKKRIMGKTKTTNILELRKLLLAE